MGVFREMLGAINAEMKDIMRRIFLFLVVVITCFFITNCVNPLKRGKWRPLPFKSMQKINTSSIPPADTSQNNIDK